jgi:hypothetical protein
MRRWPSVTAGYYLYGSMLLKLLSPAAFASGNSKAARWEMTPHPNRLGSFSVSHKMLGRLKVVGPNAIALQVSSDGWVDLKMRKEVSRVKQTRGYLHKR